MVTSSSVSILTVGWTKPTRQRILSKSVEIKTHGVPVYSSLVPLTRSALYRTETWSAGSYDAFISVSAAICSVDMKSYPYRTTSKPPALPSWSNRHSGTSSVTMVGARYAMYIVDGVHWSIAPPLHVESWKSKENWPVLTSTDLSLPDVPGGTWMLSPP